MAFFTARILSKDGVVIAEDVEVWINFFRVSDEPRWDGSLEVPVTTPLAPLTYRLQLVDGREGIIANIAAQIRGDNIVVYFEGQGPLA